MFYPFTFEYRIDFDAAIYAVVVWPFAEFMGTLAATLMGLLSLWLAMGGGNWFLWTIPVLIVIWLLTLIPAYDLGLVAALQCAIVVIPLGASRMRSSQFGLANLLLFIAVLAAVVAILSRVPSEIWYAWPTILWFGIGFGLLTLCGAAIALRRGKLGWRWLLIIIIPYVALTVVWLRLALHSSLNQHARLSRLALIVLSLFIISPILMAYGLLISRAPIPAETPPTENCLAALCDAGASLNVKQLYSLQNTRQNLTAAVSPSAAALRSARKAMIKPGWVAVNYGVQNPGDFKNRVPQRDPLDLLNRAFLAEGDLAVVEGRLGDALNSYRDVLLLAERSGRGGLPFDAGLATEFEAEGLSRVYANCDSMTKEECKKWIEILSVQEAVFESADLLRKRRYAWVDRIACWQDRVVLSYLRTIGRYYGKSRLDIYERGRPTQIRLLKCELALRAYQLDHGRYPQHLVELVPDYLAAIPVDPFSGEMLIYRTNQDRYRLYSIGPDEKDNGGVLPIHPFWRRHGDLTAGFFER